MDQQLRDRLREILATGGGEQVGVETYLPILRLESGTRYGLCADGTWVAHLLDGAALVRLGEGTEAHFCEAVECKRAQFEDLLAGGAGALGLDPDALTLSFPSVAVVRALLHRQSAHFIRLALLWLLPSELRELRQDILGVADSSNWSRSLRDLARHLVVPE